MHISGSEFKNSRPEYPEKKKELEKFAGSLKETGNRCVMVRLRHYCRRAVEENKMKGRLKKRRA